MMKMLLHLSEVYDENVTTSIGNGDAYIVSKDQILKAIDTTSPNIKSIFNFFVTVDVSGEKTTVSYRTIQEFKGSNGSNISCFNIYVLGFQKKQGKWKIVSVYIESF